jgi:hypothetical protein
MMILVRDNFVEGGFWRGMILRRGDSGEVGVCGRRVCGMGKGECGEDGCGC